MALDLNPQSPAQAATQDIEQQSANAPSVAIAPGQPEVPMAGAPSPAATPPVHPLVAGTASTTLATLNNAPPKPGNFARSVLTGLLTTMSKLGGGAEKVMAGLSQPGGGIDTLGIMAGSAPGQEYNNIQAAKVARQKQQQDQQKFLMDQHEGHARIAVQENLLKESGLRQNEAVEADSNAQLQQFMTNGGVPAASGVPASEIQKYYSMKGTAGNPLTILRTGSSETGPTYTVIDSSLVKNVPVTPEEDARWKKLGLITAGSTITSMPFSQISDFNSKARVAEIAQQTLDDTTAKLNIDQEKLKTARQEDTNRQNMGPALETFARFYGPLAQKNPGQQVENTIDAFFHMATAATGTDKQSADAKTALPVVLDSLGGLKGLLKANTVEQAATERIINDRAKNSVGLDKTLITSSTKQLSDDKTLFAKTSAEMAGLQKILNQTGNVTLMSAALKKIGIADGSVQAAKTRLADLTQQTAALSAKINSEGKYLDNLTHKNLGEPQPQTPPPGATSEVYVQGKLVGHVVNNKYVPLQ